MRALVVVLAATGCMWGQHLVPQKTFDAIAGEYSGEAAQENDRQIVQYHRIQGSPMMTEVAEKVVLAKLRGWGVEAQLEQFASDGETKYQTYVSPMGWDMRGGELWLESAGGTANFVPKRLCRYSDVPMCVSTYSKGGEWSGELVEVNGGTSDKDYEGKDVRGRVALAYGYAGAVVRTAMKRGAVGVVIYPPPGDRADHPDMVRYNGIWPWKEDLDKTLGGFQISGNQYTEISQLMRRGAVRVRGKIDATLGPGQMTLVHAWIRGSRTPQEEVLITGHLDHPKWSANDNASGSAAMLEMARTLHALIAGGKLAPPEMTIHFMWVPEYSGSVAYITKHTEARACNAGWDDPRQARGKEYKAGEPCIVLNLNLDMVGEDTVKTNSRFYITRTPDSVPGFLNGMMADVLAQTRAADLWSAAGTKNYWPAEMSGYVQGSDHDVFLALGIPSTMLGHDPDWTHHTSEDSVDKTDATEFKRVGVLATAAAYCTASEASRQDGEDWLRLGYLGTGDMVSERARRVAAVLAGPDTEASRRRLRSDLRVMGEMLAQQQRYAGSFLQKGPDASRGSGFDITTQGERSGTASGYSPRRLTLAAIDASAVEGLAGDDRAWWEQQQARFASEAPGGGLPTEPPFELIAFETVNFMDGKRSTGEIADLLSSEFNQDVDQAWVARLVGILAKLKLVTAP